MPSSMLIIGSLTIALQLGLVNDILVSDQSAKPAELSTSKMHPLRDIFGRKTLLTKSITFDTRKPLMDAKYDETDKYNNENHMAPYGLYPSFKIGEKRNSIATTCAFEPIKTSLKTYQGIERQGTRINRIHAGAHRYVTAKL